MVHFLPSALHLCVELYPDPEYPTEYRRFRWVMVTCGTLLPSNKEMGGLDAVYGVHGGAVHEGRAGSPGPSSVPLQGMQAP